LGCAGKRVQAVGDVGFLQASHAGDDVAIRSILGKKARYHGNSAKKLSKAPRPMVLLKLQGLN